MKTITEILENSPLTNYRGSESTYNAVCEEIKKRWGKAALKSYNPRLNMRTYSSWVFLGLRPKKGEKPIPSVTYIEKRTHWVM